MSDDYSKVHILLKDAVRLSNNRRYSLRKFTKYRQKIEKYRTKNRNKLLKFADKIYNLFDYEYIKEEIARYRQILTIAGAYAIDKKDKDLINLDKLYLDDLEKRNKVMKMAYETLTDVVKNHPLDQERIDLASDKFIHEAADISYIAKIKDNLKERVKQAEQYLERYRLTGRQRAAAIIGSVVIGLATYTANINAQEGFAGFGQVVYGEEYNKTRQTFRKLGWDVYDKPNWEGWKRPILKYAIKKAEIKESINKNKYNIVNKLSNDEKQLFNLITDGHFENDELRFIFVTPDNRIVMNVEATDHNIGKKGKYLVIKHVNSDIANTFRNISTDYRPS